MQIRPYQAADLQAVAALFTASIHGLALDHYDAAQRAAWAPQPPDLAQWRGRLAALQTLVAETDQGLSGFIAFAPDGHIDLLYVSPDASRRGLASALYHAAESALRTAGVSELFTEASLVAAPFFARQGFRIEAEQRVERNGQVFRRYAMRKSAAAATAAADRR